MYRSWFWDFLQRGRPQKGISRWFWDFLDRDRPQRGISSWCRNSLSLDRRQRDIKSKWPAISEALKEAGVTLHWFPWSGRNSHARRMTAGKELAVFIASLRKDHPSVQVFIIAHSHGGNVALYSLKHLEPKKVDGIVCLATPFLQFDPDRFDIAGFPFLPFAVRYTAFIAVVAPLLFLWFGTRQLVMSALPGVVVGLACVIGVIAYSAAGLFARRLTDRLLPSTDAHSKRLREACDKYEPTVRNGQPVLILRTAADEVSAILSAGLLREWLLARAWRALACLAGLPHTVFCGMQGDVSKVSADSDNATCLDHCRADHQHEVDGVVIRLGYARGRGFACLFVSVPSTLLRVRSQCFSLRASRKRGASRKRV